MGFWKRLVPLLFSATLSSFAIVPGSVIMEQSFAYINAKEWASLPAHIEIENQKSSRARSKIKEQEPEWNLLLISIPFIASGTFCISLSIYLIYDLIVHTFFSRHKVLDRTLTGSVLWQRSKSEPWLTKEEWSTPRIKSLHPGLPWWLIGPAAGMSILSIPLGYAGYLSWRHTKNPDALIVFLYLGCSLILIVSSILKTREHLRFGALNLTLSPFPGQLGGKIAGWIDSPIANLEPHKILLTLRGEVSTADASRDGKSSELLCHREMQPRPEAINQGTRLHFEFDIPSTLPPSSLTDFEDRFMRWSLRIKSKAWSFRVNQLFSIPVFHPNKGVKEPSATKIKSHDPKGATS